ncbi:alpha/beta fold hydrolase [Amycolatopsis rifamycinica]|uniref:alpha/beta fold hydrolase n=1 Tax=Amycolatopsis rifamycinica TaxID=287986 RepID=UPI002285E4BA|nr:alpha/beta hydrolase [Amycolatopsis rifamycinica]
MAGTPSLLEPITAFRPGRPLVLFLPGMSGNKRQWDFVIRRLDGVEADLAYGAPVLAHPAFGNTRPTVPQLGEALAAELTAAGRDRVTVVSHSVGAFVALVVAHELPSVVRSAVLANGGLSSVARFIDRPLRRVPGATTSRLSYLRLFVLVGTPVPPSVKRAIAGREWSSRLLVGGRLVSRPALASREARDALMEEAGNARTIAGLWQNRHYWREFERTAAEIPARVLFLVGGLDPMTSVADTGVMADLLPNAEIRLLPGVGHAAPLEAPDTVAAAIKDALAAA